jgi:hypothetical protein
MANGRELFSELFGYVLLFEQMNQQGEFQPAYEQVRRDIATLLEQEKAVAKRRTRSRDEPCRSPARRWRGESGTGKSSPGQPMGVAYKRCQDSIKAPVRQIYPEASQITWRE